MYRVGLDVRKTNRVCILHGLTRLIVRISCTKHSARWIDVYVPSTCQPLIQQTVRIKSCLVWDVHKTDQLLASIDWIQLRRVLPGLSPPNHYIHN